MFKLFDRVKVNITTTGTGDVTFGSASSNAFLTPSDAGAADGDTVRYCIVDGTDFEIGIGTIKSSVATMARTTVTKSKIGGTAGTTKLNLSGAAVLALVASAADIVNPTNNLSDLNDAAAARTNLGGTSVGKALFTAVNASDARDTLGGTTVGQAVFTAADAAAVRSAAGVSDTLPTIQRFTSGTSQTYTTPAGCRWIRVRMVGGGGGGSGGGSGAPAGSSGGASTFSGGSLSAGGGSAGVGSTTGGNGGVATNGNVASIAGSKGTGASTSPGSCSGEGGTSVFGGAGGGSGSASGGGNAATNSGSGGGGGGGNASQTGSGGGSGAYVEHIIGSPAASYTYTVGTGGSGGTAGGSGGAGGAGGAGLIIVEEYY